jgi:hypothetical protein
LRIGFEHHQQIIWDKGRTVLTRTLYWFQHEPCWFVRKKNAPCGIEMDPKYGDVVVQRWQSLTQTGTNYGMASMRQL